MKSKDGGMCRRVTAVVGLSGEGERAAAARKRWMETLKDGEVVFLGEGDYNSLLCEAASSVEVLDLSGGSREAADGGFVLFCPDGVSTDMVGRGLSAMVSLACSVGAGMVYADGLESVNGRWESCRTIECQEGALRDDFDFGKVVLVGRKLLSDFLRTTANGFEGSLFYALTLYVRRWSRIEHLTEVVYRWHQGERVADKKTGEGEQQFDYVSRRMERQQAEREALCREHLRAEGACVGGVDKMRVEDFKGGEFLVEASVIIPVRNREATVADAVRSALAQETDFSFNVIVVDNRSTDGTGEVLEGLCGDGRVVHVVPESEGLGIGGCWDLAVRDSRCGRFAVQLDSDDLYASKGTLQTIVDEFRRTGAALVVGSYRLVDFDLNELPPGVIDHREWSDENGCNNALRINGFGAPRAFYTPLLREVGFPNVSYGEDYAVCLRLSAGWKVARIYEVLYLCRRWKGNSDASLDRERVNINNRYKDNVRTHELHRRRGLYADSGVPSQREMKDFFERQLASWREVRGRFAGLRKVKTRRLSMGAGGVCLQFNPDRIRSTGAKVDGESIKKRACFLCPENQPKEQWRRMMDGGMWLCINPFPILEYHLTLPANEHRRQEFLPMMDEMLRLVEAWPDMVVFYNGPQCGASAPDHAHLQTGQGCNIPLRSQWREHEKRLMPVEPGTAKNGGAGGIYLLEDNVVPVVVVKSCRKEETERLVRKVVEALPQVEGEWEPRMNVLAWTEPRVPHETEWVVCIIARKKLRPDCFFAEGAEKVMVSPGCIDMAGLIITPREEDFRKLTREKAEDLLREVALSPAAMAGVLRKLRGDRNDVADPMLSVGILEAERARIALEGVFTVDGNESSGTVEICASDGCLVWEGKDVEYESLLFEPASDGAVYRVGGVVIGKDFHWQRREDQTFKGSLWIVPRGSVLRLIGRIGLEDYIESVIASEMRATAGIEFLKASAIVSRSWLLAGFEGREEVPQDGKATDGEVARWTDRGVHLLYDVCADDHCQRYQGVVRAANENVVEALRETRGMVLMSGGKVCDARFSKCCGGCSEEFATCWQDVDVSYLQVMRDNEKGDRRVDLSDEKAAEQWILSEPEAYCNTDNGDVIGQILNDYDLETTRFFRWSVEIEQGSLQGLLKEKLGIDIGDVLNITPLERGRGGRLKKIRIEGTKGNVVVGKELEIRRVLSETHLLSSAFVVTKVGVDEGGVPQCFRIRGAGWGHGVGMCQIGAARMATEGADYGEILRHYFGDGVEIVQLGGRGDSRQGL